MSELEEKNKKFEVIKHKIDSLTMALRDISDEEIGKLSVKDLHAVDKHIFEIMKIIEQY